jgi:hypothetical protein
MRIGVRDTQADPLLVAGLDHSWKWVDICTNRQAQSFNLYLIAMAFLTAGYFTAISARLQAAALAVAVAGICASVGFGYEDYRVRRYVEAGNRALVALQGRLASLIDCPEIKMVEAARSVRPMRLKLSFAAFVTSSIAWIAALVHTSRLG